MQLSRFRGVDSTGVRINNAVPDGILVGLLIARNIDM
jgi:hypothetical protein